MPLLKIILNKETHPEEKAPIIIPINDVLV